MELAARHLAEETASIRLTLRRTHDRAAGAGLPYTSFPVPITEIV